MERKLIMAAIAVVIVIITGWWIVSFIKGVPMISFFTSDEKMGKTATVLRSIKNTNRWVFLTVEDEEVVVRETTFNKVAKVYPAVYELGINLDDNLDWITIRDLDSVKYAILELPQIKILNEKYGIDDTKVINVYGDTDDEGRDKMRKEAEFRLKTRACSGENIEQAKISAKKHFDNLFSILGCNGVEIKWKDDEAQ